MIAKSPSADRIPIKSLVLLNHIKAITDQKSLHLIFQTSKQGSGLVEYRLKIEPVEASVTEAKRREEVNQIQGASIPPFVWGEKNIALVYLHMSVHVCEREFKPRCLNHKGSNASKSKRNNTKLFIRMMKHDNIETTTQARRRML